MFNKTIFSVYKFRSPIFLACVHMMISFSAVVACKRMGWISYPDFDRKTFKRMLPLSICFISNILLGLVGTKLINVPMFTTLRRLTALLIITSEFVLHGTIPPKAVCLAVALLCLGALVAGFNDLYFDAMGYIVVIMNNCATAGYLVFTKKIKDELNAFGLIYYNTMISFPLMLVICIALNEFDYVYNFENLHEPFFQISFCAGGLLAFTVNLTTAWCTQVNSPLTTSVVGQTKNVVLTAAGAILFDDFKPNLWIVSGITISICGSTFYAWIKLQASKRRQHQKDPELGKASDLERVPLISDETRVTVEITKPLEGTLGTRDRKSVV